MIRELILDTETTGLSYKDDRMVSLGIVELIDGHFAGREQEWYFNPEQECTKSAYAVHKLPDWWLAERPLFSSCAREISDFIGDDGQIIAHNAVFDRTFLNNEFARLLRTSLKTDEELHRYPEERWIDTAKIARKRYPRQPAKLDDLADRFGVYRGHRIKHGALKDARILAEVWRCLRRGEQQDLLDGEASAPTHRGIVSQSPEVDYENRPPMKNRLTSAENKTHAKYVEDRLGHNAVWYDYLKMPSKLAKQKAAEDAESDAQG